MELKSLSKDEKAEYAAFIGMAILAIVALVVIGILGSALVPTVISTTSNTSAITGYSTWAAGTQSMYTAIPTFIGLDYLLVYVILALILVRSVTGS